MASPRIAVRLTARFAEAPAGYRDPLVTIGHSHYGYFFYAERAPGALRLVSQAEGSRLEYLTPDPAGAPLALGLAYAPETGEMVVSVNGGEALRHRVGMLVTAPAQVEIGENDADFGLT